MNLETERLLLRPHEPGDIDALYELWSDIEVSRFQGAPLLTFEQSQDLLNKIIESRAKSALDTLPHNFVITLRESGQVIGTCRLGMSLETTDVVYVLLPRYWGQGYATEAVKALIAYGFDKRGVGSIFGICVPENIASSRVMEKAGMQEDGLIQRYAADGHWYQGKFRDVTYRRFVITRQPV